ncbi:MAG: hypothetical protein ACI9CA_002481 [Natronomonas sp.]|jgi:hypothetical protein
MSNASPYESDSAVTSWQPGGVAALHDACLSAVRFVGFWTAVLLPFVLVTLLASGLIATRPFVAGGLLAVNLAGLVVGRDYNR